MPRIDWEDLPASVRQAVEQRSGKVLKAVTASGGVNSGVAAVLATAGGDVFVKGIPVDHPQARTQRREAAVNSYLGDVAPRLLWEVRADGWDLLGLERVNGRHADFRPGSPDLSRVADLLNRVACVPRPAVALKRLDERFASYADADEVHHFRGETLLHTDCAPHNILVSNQRTVLIDWAWPTLGPAWADGAYLVTRLVDAGHTAAAADAWAKRELSAWAQAPAESVSAFARASTRLWDEIAESDPQDWKLSLARSARAWAAYVS